MKLPKDPNTRVVFALVSVVLTMGALAWAAVPFYSWFCRVTGFAGTTSTAVGPADKVLDETILIRFDANTDPGMPWEFKPVVKKMTLHIGETGMAFFEAYNPTDHPIGGSASFNVAPDSSGGYFTKIDCFCFTEQILRPHERVQMPVTFYVDPDIKNDPDAKYVHEITLSYTFYQTELTEEQLTQLAIDPPIGQRTTN
ncbi:cytochrome c oxidase assembly protein [Frigidibacter sp. ROC022]|uniref:cytochrome c oxidase assembly protein n=1 Tax=Frigidibacter sp. ROC022 TaxID=2971796 RepID=UPI00215A7ED7|nr:cytochrome c oxidase assembly protein [Frigidibacter sp. ROC022]MCR8723985.1 cytochrome c oxidase assembly protein [Frigidibacter sp. ROC022]